MSKYSLPERLQSVYEYWNADYSDGLPEGAGVLLEAAAALRELEAENLGMRRILQEIVDYADSGEVQDGVTAARAALEGK